MHDVMETCDLGIPYLGLTLGLGLGLPSVLRQSAGRLDPNHWRHGDIIIYEVSINKSGKTFMT